MATSGTFVFADPDGYAAKFGDARVNLTITGAGDFNARLTRLKLTHLEICRFRESLPRIAYISLPPEQIYLSFPVGKAPLIFNGFTVRDGDIILHGLGASMHQRSSRACQWGLITLSPHHLSSCSKALTGRSIESPHVGRILRPSRAQISGFQRLFRQACRLTETRQKLIEHPEVARALEQEMLHAIINCLATGEADDSPRNGLMTNGSKTRHRHASVMVCFEGAVNKHIGQKLNLPALCAAIGVPERTLRSCCGEFLGVSPMRYLLLRRLNKARSALLHADSSTVSVKQIARNYQFMEPGRFAVTYRTTFGETPSATLERAPRSSAEGA
jgi:AraC-like DNA-binding protein